MTIPGIVINTTFNNTALPTALSRQQRIAAIPSLEMWAQADAAHITLGGSTIQAFRDVAGGDGVFTPIDITETATLLAGELGGYSVAEFADTPSDVEDRYTSSGFNVTADTPYSYVVVFKPGDLSVDRSIIGRIGNATSRALLGLSTSTWSKGRLYHGSSTVYLPIATADWNLMIVSFDGTNVIADINGTTTAPTAVTGTTSSAVIGLGGHSDVNPFDGQLADAMIFSESIVGTPTADLIKAHFAALYGPFDAAVA